MFSFEEKFFEWVRKNILIIAFCAITILGMGIRICGIDFESGDFRDFLNPWWNIIKGMGLEGVSKKVGNYNMPYQTITFLMTLLPWKSIVAYKTLSIIFDFVMAMGGMLFVYEVTKSQAKAVVGYALTICSVNVFLNSAFWAQCDSIYVAFIILAIYFLMKDRNEMSFIMLGLSFAFKLQMVFILPVFLFYYVLTKKISVVHFLIILIVDVLMSLPALFLGRNVRDLYSIYVEQTDYGKKIQMNFPNFYAMICDGADKTYYELFKGFSIMLTIAILGFMLAMFIYKQVDLTNKKYFLMTAIWTSFTCIMFLSSMHERYSYLLDILLILFAIVYGELIIPAILSNLISLRGYSFYLFNFNMLEFNHAAIINFGLYLYITYVLVKEILLKDEAQKIESKK
ncbi:MAG: hypothetical protein K6G85_06540 [Eubacterium sp.]|nr:hypothetical protein [Eubacterium sp.]